MIDVECCKGSISIKKIFDWYKARYVFRKEHPDYFNPCGTVVFCGGQGHGKSLSAYKYVLGLLRKYPKCILVTNLDLRDYPIDNKRIFPFLDNDDLINEKYRNGEYGVIFFIDEIQIYLNSLQSKNLNMDVAGLLAMQRKNRLHIVSTSQRIGRTAKQLREQYPCLVKCTNVFGESSIFGFLQRNDFIADADVDDSGHVEGKVTRKFFWIHDVDDYGGYDTYAILRRGKFATGEEVVRNDRS